MNTSRKGGTRKNTVSESILGQKYAKLLKSREILCKTCESVQIVSKDQGY